MTSSYEVTLFNGTKKMISTNSRPIDPKKFKQILLYKNLEMKEIAASIGYASNSVSSALNCGYFTNVMILGIERIYGIKYEDYAFVHGEEPKQQEAVPQVSSPEQMAELYNIIKSAVVDGMNESIAGNMKNLRGGIYTAIYQAVNAAKKEQ